MESKILPKLIKVHEPLDEVVERFYTEEIRDIVCEEENMFLWTCSIYYYDQFRTPQLDIHHTYAHKMRAELRKLTHTLMKDTVTSSLNFMCDWCLEVEPKIGYFPDYILVGVGDDRTIQKKVKYKERELDPTIRIDHGAGTKTDVSFRYPATDRVLEYMCCVYARMIDNVIYSLDSLK